MRAALPAKPPSSARRAGTRSRSRSWGLGLLLAAGGALLSLPVAAEEAASGEFRRAMRLFLDPEAARRAEGERQLRSMGKRALPELEAWVARGGGDLDRVRGLLASLGGKAEGFDDPLAAARPFLAQALAGAWERYHAGEHLEARRTAEAVLRLDPESPERWQIRRLIRQCEERQIQTELLQPSVEFARQVYPTDAEPRVSFRLHNRSRKTVGLRAERGILGLLHVAALRRLIDGSERSDERTLAIRTEREEERLAIEPGARYEREIAIPIEEPRRERGMVVRIRVVGKFQPSQWGLEELNLSRSLSLPPAECWVVAPKELPLAEAPLQKLETAIFFRDLHAYFTGGQLAVWAAEDDPLLHARLLRVLVESLGELDETGVRVADSLLAEASGQRRERKLESAAAIAESWRKWWAERRRREGEAAVDPPALPRLLNK